MQIAQHNRQVMQQLQQQRLLLGGTHPLQLNSGITLHQASHMPLVNSPSSGNILHVCINSICTVKWDLINLMKQNILAINTTC